MNAALGRAGVVLGFVAALGGITTVVIAMVSHRRALLRQLPTYVGLVAAGGVLSFAAMERGLITRDFSLEYVADVGSTNTPALFNFAALWSSLEGSILLWSLILAGYLVAVAVKFRHRLTDPLVGWALLVLFVVCVFFFGLMLGPANPFRTLAEIPADGTGPNPLLQNNVLMAFHPPLLYLGYVGFSVPFAFAVAALATGRVGEGWLVETRRWTLFAWGFLSVGILLGAWWSYEVLGWGGYWAWDPVENASLLPWLTGTAYLHSVMVQERRGMLRVWNLSLLIATFSLTILGTFLTRSGVLDSVHAFSNSTIGPLLLSFFGLIVVVGVGLIGWRGDRLRAPGRIDSPVSREGAFLINNLLFAAFAFVVLLGTVFPLLMEAINGDRISVGGPYFDSMAAPIAIGLLFLMAAAPALPWRKAATETLGQRLLVPAWVGAGSLILAIVLGARGWSPLLAFGLGGFAAGAAIRQIVLATRRQGWRGFLGRTNGGMIVHLGVVILAVAFAASSSFDTEREVILEPGERVEVAGHTLAYQGLETVSEPNRTDRIARVSIDGGQAYTPRLQRFPQGTQEFGRPSVRSSWREDVYLALLEAPDDPTGPVRLRVIVLPLVAWLWIGGGVMAVGAGLAAFPGRRRRGTEPTSAPVVTGAAGGDGDRGTGGATPEAAGAHEGAGELVGGQT